MFCVCATAVQIILKYLIIIILAGVHTMYMYLPLLSTFLVHCEGSRYVQR